MKIYIKNMVCLRCKLVVEMELKQLGLHPVSVELGEADIQEELSSAQLTRFNDQLRQCGLELMDDHKSILVEKVKTLIIELVQEHNAELSTNLSDYLSDRLNHDYTYLANLFSEVKGTSIEKFFLAHKIERVKELLIYEDLTLSEIADMLHYSSVAHLSGQFHKLTGLTPTHFRQLKDKRLKMLDQV